MNFGQALEKIQEGLCLQRAGWNGKGMHVYLEDHFHCLVGKGGGLEHTRKYGAVMVLYTATATHQPGWVPSQEDMLADDWKIVEQP